MSELRKFVAPEYIFGAGALDLVGMYAVKFGAQKVFVVTDPGVMAAGWSEKVVDCLADAGLASHVFSEVSANPRSGEVMAGAAIYEREGCDVIVAIGGGSPMDCAKGIGIVVSNERDVLSFEGIDNVDIPAPPLICIPTTAGSSADVSQFAIISDPDERVKKAIISKTTVPDIALIDPATTVTMDRFLTSCTAMDALVHAIEAFSSTAHSPLYDLHALEAIRVISACLPRALNNLADLELRTQIMYGSLQAGLAFSNASLGAVHAMAHSLGGFLDLPHGECNAILLEHVFAYNFATSDVRLSLIAKALGVFHESMQYDEILSAVLDTLVRLKLQAGITRTLVEHGMTRDDIPLLSQKAMKDPCMVTNPRMPMPGDIEELYERAL